MSGLDLRLVVQRAFLRLAIGSGKARADEEAEGPPHLLAAVRELLAEALDVQLLARILEAETLLRRFPRLRGDGLEQVRDQGEIGLVVHHRASAVFAETALSGAETNDTTNLDKNEVHGWGREPARAWIVDAPGSGQLS